MYNKNMEELDIENIKKVLLEEQESLEKELGKIAHKNPKIEGEWDPVPEEPDTSVADKNDVADRLEDFSERQSTENTLEERYHQVQKALKKIEEGTYGICEISGEKIPIERLRANPAATTKAEYAE